ALPLAALEHVPLERREPEVEHPAPLGHAVEPPPDPQSKPGRPPPQTPHPQGRLAHPLHGGHAPPPVRHQHASRCSTRDPAAPCPFGNVLRSIPTGSRTLTHDLVLACGSVTCASLSSRDRWSPSEITTARDDT